MLAVFNSPMFADGFPKWFCARSQVGDVHACVPCFLLIDGHARGGDYQRSQVAPLIPLRMVLWDFDGVISSFRGPAVSRLFRGVRVMPNVGEVTIKCVLE